MDHNQALACWLKSQHGRLQLPELWHVMALLSQVPARGETSEPGVSWSEIRGRTPRNYLLDLV